MTGLAATLPAWSTPPRGERPRTRLAVVLAAALALHAVVIGIPLRLGGPGAPARPPLSVQLDYPATPTATSTTLPTTPATTPAVPRELPAERGPPADTAAPVPEAARAPARPDTRPTTSTTEPATEPSPERVPGTPATPRRVITTATLLDGVRQRDWRAPLLPETDAPARTDGEAAQREGRGWPRAWSRPVLPVTENLFDDAVLPAETEIVDRWRAADGAHEVVVRTPTGQTLCGRAQAWNPMDPLVEPIMMFRSCGGGGERRFRPGVVRDDR